MSEKTSTSPLKQQLLYCEVIYLSPPLLLLLRQEQLGDGLDGEEAFRISNCSCSCHHHIDLVIAWIDQRKDSSPKRSQNETRKHSSERFSSAPNSPPPVSTARSLSSSSTLIPLSGSAVRACVDLHGKFDTCCTADYREDLLCRFCREIDTVPCSFPSIDPLFWCPFQFVPDLS